ncbi:MAG: hypothetical protein LBL35_05475 [Clostridiales bacterium]|jgi:hypothetical protein|nr:hypothetical protein [Clostridiales bacterium]
MTKTPNRTLYPISRKDGEKNEYIATVYVPAKVKELREQGRDAEADSLKVDNLLALDVFKTAKVRRDVYHTTYKGLCAVMKSAEVYDSLQKKLYDMLLQKQGVGLH